MSIMVDTIQSHKQAILGGWDALLEANAAQELKCLIKAKCPAHLRILDGLQLRFRNLLYLLQRLRLLLAQRSQLIKALKGALRQLLCGVPAVNDRLQCAQDLVLPRSQLHLPAADEILQAAPHNDCQKKQGAMQQAVGGRVCKEARRLQHGTTCRRRSLSIDALAVSSTYVVSVDTCASSRATSDCASWAFRMAASIWPACCSLRPCLPAQQSRRAS